MSIFKSITKDDETKLQERYEKLCAYATVFNIKKFSSFLEDVGMEDGITSEKLDKLQLLVDTEQSQVHINSRELADWYGKKKGLWDKEIEMLKEQFKLNLKHAEAERNALIFLFEKEAQEFAMTEYQRTGDKTLRLQHCHYVITTTKPSWKIENEAELQHWLMALPNTVKEFLEVRPKSWTRNLEKVKDYAIDYPVAGLKYDEGGDKVSLRLPKEIE